jgi:hypothetical protein
LLPYELRRYREWLFDAVSHADHQLGTIVDRIDQQVANTSQLLAGVAGVEANSDAIAADVARLAAVADRALPAIVEYLSFAAERLGGIDQMLANPTETAAAEFYRRGSYALASGWLEEATDDLWQAVETYPYHPESWFNLGIVLARQGYSEVAADAFLKCGRYSVTRSPVLAATAVLLAAELYRHLDWYGTAAQALHKFLPQLDACAEIHLTLAVHHGELDHLRPALELAPVLATDARAAGVTSVHETAVSVCRHHDGPVARLHRLEGAMQAVGVATKAVGLEDVCRVSDLVALPRHGVDALLIAEASLPMILVAARQLVGEVRSALARLEAAVSEAAFRATRARAKLVPQAADGIRQQVLLAIEAVALVEEKVTGSRQKAWNLALEAREIVWTAEAAIDVALGLEEESKLPHRDGGDWRSPTREEYDEEIALRWRDARAVEAQIGQCQQAAEQAQSEVDQAEEEARSLPLAAEAWLRAAQEAHMARSRAAQSKWEAEQAQSRVRRLELDIRAVQEHQERQRQSPYPPYIPPTPLLREIAQRFESRIRQRLDQARRIAQEAEASLAKAASDAQVVEKLATELAQKALRDAEQAAEEPCRQVERAAEEAVESFQRARDTVAAPLEKLLETIEAVSVPRQRIIPFTVPRHLELTEL